MDSCIADFTNHFGKHDDPGKLYTREPFAANVSAGKYDTLCKAYSYHTRAPTDVSLLPALRLMMTNASMNRFIVARAPGS